MSRVLSAVACGVFASAVLVAADEPAGKWDKEVAAIEKRNQDAAPGGIVFAGSSSIRLWDVKKSFPDRSVVNAGFGGSQIRDCTQFAARLVTVHKPAAVVFYAGDNDIGAGRTAEQVRDDFAAFADAVHKEAPKCRVWFVAVKPSPKRWAKYDTQTKANALVKTLCEKDATLGFIDVVPAMLGPDGKPIPELFTKDDLHMTPKGYEVWTAAVNKALGK